MKIILDSWRRHYLSRVNIFLAIVALIIGIAGCGDVEGEGGDDYFDLTISSTMGGSVIEPGEGHFDYAENTMVDLVAEANEHYHFVNWTGNVSNIADVDSATTNITMYDSYSIIANFELDPGWYSLTISSTSGGSVTTPGEGISVYADSTVVDLVAEPSELFINWTGEVDTIANITAATTTITMNDSYSISANFVFVMVDAGAYHTVGVKSDGTVVAVGPEGGDDDYGQCNVDSWTGITQVAAGVLHTVGLKSDGSVVAVGWNHREQCNVGGWTDIIQVAAYQHHTVGLRSDGTVVAVGLNNYGQCNVGNWTDIVQIAVGDDHTLGLKSDGTVVAVGYNHYGVCNVNDWIDITQVATGYRHTVGLKADGTLVAVGENDEGQCDVDSWTDITQVSADTYITVGLKTNGTTVAVGYNSYGQCNVGNWTDIIQVAAGWSCTVGVKVDGTVVAVGCGRQCDVGSWDLTT